MRVQQSNDLHDFCVSIEIHQPTFLLLHVQPKIYLKKKIFQFRHGETRGTFSGLHVKENEH